MLSKKNNDNLNLHKKQNCSVLLLRKDFEEYDFDLKNMLRWTYYPNYCFATIIDNKIASCASAGYHVDKVNDSIVEITTATHKDYRGKGFAVSNVVALCEYVLNMQEEREVYYITDINNIASQKTALSAGLINIWYINYLLKKVKSKLR